MQTNAQENPIGLDVVRTELFRKLVNQGAEKHRSKNVLFWTDAAAIIGEKKNQVNKLVQSAYDRGGEDLDRTLGDMNLKVARDVFQILKDDPAFEGIKTPEDDAALLKRQQTENQAESEKTKGLDIAPDAMMMTANGELLWDTDDSSEVWRDMVFLIDLAKVPGTTILDIRRAAERLVEKSFFYQHQAIIEPGTGIYTRAFCVEAIKELFESYIAGDTDSAICFTDVDGIKELNDKKGYAFGDGAIYAQAQALEATGNIVGRFFTGDEDIVIMPSYSNQQEIEEVFQQAQGPLMDQVVERMKLANNPDRQIAGKINFSYGYTTFAEVLDFLSRTNPNLTSLPFSEIVNEVVDTAIRIGQTNEIIHKNTKRGIAEEEIRKIVRDQLLPRFAEQTDMVVDYCIKKRTKNG